MKFDLDSIGLFFGVLLAILGVVMYVTIALVITVSGWMMLLGYE